MLSKKMAVSLTSLITIFALAFVAPTAMAATFEVALAEHPDQPDIGVAPGLQIERDGTTLKVKVMFGEFVVLATTDVMVAGFDKDDVYIPTVVVAKVDPATAAKEITVEITITAETSRVTVAIEEGIKSAVTFSENTSAELPATDIHLYSGDVDISPEVYGIRRADNSSVPLTSGPVTVVITLSEQPESFDTQHINVMGGTAGTPVKLNTIRQNAVGLSQFASHVDKPLLTEYTPMQIRDGILKTGDNGDARDEYDFKGINYYLSTVALAGGLPEDGGNATTVDDIPPDYIAAVNKLKAEIGAAATGVMYYSDNNDGIQQTAVTIQHGDTAATPGANVTTMPLKDGDKLTGSVRLPSTQGTADLVEANPPTGAVAIRIPKETFVRSKKAKDYTRPALDDENYAFKLRQYYLLTGIGNDGTALTGNNDATDQQAAYEKEKKIYDAYIALQKLIQDDRMEEILKREEELIAAARTGDTTQIADNVLPPTGRDGMLHPYAVPITPNYTSNSVIVSVNRWQNMGADPGVYKPPVLETGYTEGFDKLTIKVVPKAAITPAAVPRGVIEITLPMEVTIPASSPGFLIFSASPWVAGLNVPNDMISDMGLTTAASEDRTPAERLYEIIDVGRLAWGAGVTSPLPNLQNFFTNGGTVHLKGPKGLIISEVMWGTDASLFHSAESQWIEVKNVSGAPLTAAPGTLGLIFVAPNETLPAGTTPVDTIGTYDPTTKGVWDITTAGQPGRTGTFETAEGVAAVVPTTPLISMQRVFKTTAQKDPLPGTLATSWVSSKRPALNFSRTAVGERIGTPGAEPLTPVVAPPKPVPTKPPMTPIAKATDIKITEIMVDTSSGLFPQWIELTSEATGKVSLNGWEMVIDNAIDAQVLGGGNPITVSLSGITLDVSKDTGNLGAGQSVLVVAWATRRHSPKIRSTGVHDISGQLSQTGRYQLLSYEGFRIALIPPKQTAITSFGDIAGNLDEEWDLPMLEGPKRSSLIRREMDTMPNQATHVASKEFMGTQAEGWILASTTSLIKGPETFYGNDEDAGTPGYDAGGPLPVELSHFRPVRDKQTGQVVITWATQSELNNAGFFIKRSNQRHGQFTVINATMVPGAGTTSEKQFYTYTDTTAQPNVVYYYQIEDVSLDGNRQLLTRGIRLKGHVGAAGKATTLWGELKTSHE